MLLVIVVSSAVGFIVALVTYFFIYLTNHRKTQAQVQEMVETAQQKALSIVREAEIDAKAQSHELQKRTDEYVKEKKDDLFQKELLFLNKENTLNLKLQSLEVKNKNLDQKLLEVEQRLSEITNHQQTLEQQVVQRAQELERIAGMSAKEAKEELISSQQKEVEQEVAIYYRDRYDEIEHQVQESAKNLIALSMQAIAHEEAISRSITVVELPFEEIKGRIIGKEGRNIKAIEKYTGVDVIIDDTPSAILLSCFDPIRREVAAIAVRSLIADGRIQPGKIESAVQRAEQELDDFIRKTGEETIFKLRISRMDPELVYLIGKLKYRYSYGQSVLKHSIETAQICGKMASELGLNVQLAKRAGLLHDIGKALDFENEGTHVDLGYRVAKQAGEHEVVLNAIQAHHGDVPCESIIAHLVIAADALSAARPGARKENIENYISRLVALEKISLSYHGVKKAYAISAGREIRVLVSPEKLDEIEMIALARKIKQRIESELNYPGNVKVNVIREVRVIEIAR